MIKAGTRVMIKSEYDYIDDYEGTFTGKQVQFRIGKRWHEWIIKTDNGTITSAKMRQITRK